MAEAVIMPKLEMDMEDAVLIEWLKSEGDAVELGEPLFEIETAKAVLQVEAEATGVLLKTLYPAGETIAVTKTIAWIGEAGEDIPETPDESMVAAQSAAATESPATSLSSQVAQTSNTAVAATSTIDGKIPATPAAKRLAGEQGISLGNVQPSGLRGEVKLRDIEAAVASQACIKATPLAKSIAASQGIDLRQIAGSGFGGKIFKRDLATSPVAPREDRREPLSQLRRIIAERMTDSACNIPQAMVQLPVDVTDLMQLRKTLNEMSAVRLTLTDFVARAAAMCLPNFPACNASFDGDAILYRGPVHLGIAVAAERGLLVPVIRQADQLDLQTLSSEIRRVAVGVRDNKIAPGELSGSTFTISNLGMYGVTSFTPVLNPPESAILGVCGVEDLPAVENGQLVTRKKMNLCLTIDHRVLDGAIAAEFLAALRNLLENPVSLVLNQGWEFAANE